MAKKNRPMTKEDARRIQRSTAKKNHGKVPKKGFASRAQSTADKNDNEK